MPKLPLIQCDEDPGHVCKAAPLLDQILHTARDVAGKTQWMLMLYAELAPGAGDESSLVEFVHMGGPVNLVTNLVERIGIASTKISKST